MARSELIFCALTHSKASSYQTNQITNSFLSFGQEEGGGHQEDLSLSQENDM